MTTSAPTSRTVALVANSAWNLWNFRRGLIVALLKDGHAVHLLGPPGPEQADLTALGATYHALRHFERSGHNPLRDLALTRELRAVFRAVGVEVCLLYTVKAVIYGSFAARLTGARAVATLTGLGYAFIHGGRTNRLVRWLYRRALRYADRVLFHNADDLALFVDDGLVPAAKAGTVPGSGLPLADYAPTGYERAEPGLFLFVGRLLADKGVREFVAAARLLRRRRPDLRCAVLGPLDPGNPAAVTAAELAAWTAENIITYYGPTDDVRPFITAASAVVLPSYREGCPRVLLEAGALGRAVVGTDVPGVRQVIADGETGRLVPVRDAAALATVLEELADRPALLAAYGVAGRRRVGELFSEGRVVGVYRGLVRQSFDR